MPNEINENLEDSAKNYLSDSEVFGEVSERTLERMWNRMVKDFEVGDYSGVINRSKEIQGLVRTLVRDYDKFVEIKELLETLRFLVAKEMKIDASWIIEDCKKEILKSNIHIGQGR